MDKGEQADVVYLNFPKAFKEVLRQKLLGSS